LNQTINFEKEMKNLLIRKNDSSMIDIQNYASTNTSLHLNKHKLRATKGMIDGKLLRSKAATTSTPKLLIVRSASQAGGIAAIHPKNNIES
jgi:hypothetical protein